jgi:DNA-binding SARP family transcriptional activator
MRCYAKVGDRSQALKLYQRFSDRLRKELDAEPEEETRELADELRVG